MHDASGDYAAEGTPATMQANQDAAPMPMPIPDAELARLRELIRRFDLVAAEEALLALAEPCYRLTIPLADPPGDTGTTDPPRAASYLGGTPDVPRDFNWPTVQWPGTSDVFAAGFIGQIALAELPSLPGSPLPKSGLLSVFHFDQAVAPEDAFVVHWFAATNELVRVDPWPLGPERCASELGLCLDGRAYLLRAAVGVDLDQKGSYHEGPWDAIIRQLGTGDRYSDAGRAVFSRLQEVADRALDPDYDLRPRGTLDHLNGVAGQLLGRAGLEAQRLAACRALDVAADDEDTRYAFDRDDVYRDAGRRWRLLLQLENNGLIGFSSPHDADPVLILRRDDDPRPWQRFDPLFATTR